jgi:hypothetical protein
MPLFLSGEISHTDDHPRILFLKISKKKPPLPLIQRGFIGPKKKGQSHQNYEGKKIEI